MLELKNDRNAYVFSRGDVEAMADYVPAKVIISRDSFDSDTAMANAYYILRDRGIELKLV